ncbi:hypothetical protein WJX73_007243 [Symbiochloris irregularis]|uniref:diphthine methyl ester synthase n=1 Tax=Symbiochloris irregularis TaxID=706552 RepID=A0AAW1NT54_9CHLO
MVLHIIGLGLHDEKDITVRGLEIVRQCSRVYLENYTSILMVDSSKLEEFYGVSVTVADREMESDKMLEGADKTDVAFLVVGDPFGATTHNDFQLRARELGIPVNVIHNASIMNAVGACGLQLYRFGEAISIVFFIDTWKPDSWYSKMLENRRRGLHTLCLLDIQVKEPSWESLARGTKDYQPPRFMSVRTAIEQLLEVEESRQEGAVSSDLVCVGLARVGCPDQRIVAGTLAELLDVEFGPPLHSLCIPGTVHSVEEEMLNMYKLQTG